MSNNNSHKILPSVVIRRSIALFIIRIILLELLFEIIYLTWRGVIHFLPFSLETTIVLNGISILLFLVFITLVQNLILIGMALRWVNDYYEIRSDELVHIKGILSKTESAYPYRDIQSITIHQGFFGRIFNYGDVSLYIPTLGHDLHFNEISDPNKFAELIKSANPSFEGGKFIFRR
jgi:membrane protein YdbS with pleckstrin-like domain